MGTRKYYCTILLHSVTVTDGFLADPKFGTSFFGLPSKKESFLLLTLKLWHTFALCSSQKSSSSNMQEIHKPLRCSHSSSNKLCCGIFLSMLNCSSKRNYFTLLVGRVIHLTYTAARARQKSSLTSLLSKHTFLNKTWNNKVNSWANKTGALHYSFNYYLCKQTTDSSGRALFIALDLGVLFLVAHQHTKQEFAANSKKTQCSTAIQKHNST